MRMFIIPFVRVEVMIETDPHSLTIFQDTNTKLKLIYRIHFDLFHILFVPTIGNDTL